MGLDAVLRSVILCLCVAPFGGLSLAGSSEFAGLPNFHQVNQRVYRGGQPSRDGFRSLARLGVRTVVDLRSIGEHSQEGERRQVEALGMRYVSVPMKGMSAPTDGQVAAALAELEVAEGGPVFVHCLRGADRTGTVIACYRIAHEHWENRRALREARSFGMRWFFWNFHHYILRFQAGTAAPTN